MAFSPPVVCCLVKKGLQKGESWGPQDPPGYAGGYESLYRQNSKVMLAHEPSFKITDSEILGFLDDFLPFSLFGHLASPTICCCAVVTSGEKTASEIELGPCSPKSTAATA